MNERDMKVLLTARAIKKIQVHYGVMSQGFMIVADGAPLETSKGQTREFKTLDAAAKLLFKMGIGEFSVLLKTTI